jgi:hypothetical protein
MKYFVKRESVAKTAASLRELIRKILRRNLPQNEAPPATSGN